jgi:DNA-binding Lrp family transcriptional regulator
LKDPSLRVLKVMNEVTVRTDLNGFARMVGLTPTETIEQFQELLRAGLVRKSGNGYGVTAKGKFALKAIAPVSKGREFHFYNEIDKPTGFHAESIISFYELVKLLPTESIEFHLYRGDFENWFQEEFEDAVLANELAGMKGCELKDEALRREILVVLEERYGVKEP